MKIFFAGSEPTQYSTLLAEAGVKNALQSYFHLKGRPPQGTFETILLDSGGYTARTRNIEISVEKYAEYINKYNVKIAFNLDTNDTEQTLANQNYLIKACPNAYILPIFHMSDWLESGTKLLEQFIAEGFPFIALGGVAGARASSANQHKFYNVVFAHTRDKIKIHGLGITAVPMLQRYPWYSVDSTSWQSMMRFGSSSHHKDKQLMRFKAKSNHYMVNSAAEIQTWLKIERDATLLWTKRGITWD